MYYSLAKNNGYSTLTLRGSTLQTENLYSPFWIIAQPYTDSQNNYTNWQHFYVFLVSLKVRIFCVIAKTKAIKYTLLRVINGVINPWPWDSIDDVFYVEANEYCVWNMEDVIAGLSHFMRHNKVDRIVALDDFDVEKAALMREEFRMPGMGQTTMRYFRDKLAMRMKAQEEGVRVPAFSSLFNDEDIRTYIKNTQAPWVVKPRGEASAMGIQKVKSEAELWEAIHSLGNERHEYLVEQFKPGSVYHVDSLSSEGKVVFSRVSQYMNTPFEVAHGGGIFRSHLVPHRSDDDVTLRKLNTGVMQAFGMQYSASHTEFIKCEEDNEFYFLETASRVGGAHLAEMVEMASGLNLWGEWARIESAKARNEVYYLPESRKDYAGIIVSLARQKDPDTSSFNDPEIAWRLKKESHIGFILRSDNLERIKVLLDDYAERIAKDFHASAPPGY